MTNLENLSRRIIGVRAVSAGPLLFCEAGNFSPAVGEWVTVEAESGKVPAQVVLPDSLVETSQLESNLPNIVGMAAETGLVESKIPSAVEAAASRKFRELSVAHNWPYTLKEVDARPDRLIVRFTATPEPEAPDYVPLLEGLAEISKTRVELFLVSEDATPYRPPADESFAGWVNGLLKELAPVVLENAAVGAPLLDESEVYRPGQRSKERRGDEKVEAVKPVASYDPVLQTFVPNEVEGVSDSDRGAN